jgi:hypothetical protein
MQQMIRIGIDSIDLDCAASAIEERRDSLNHAAPSALEYLSFAQSDVDRARLQPVTSITGLAACGRYTRGQSYGAGSRHCLIVF